MFSTRRVAWTAAAALALSLSGPLVPASADEVVAPSAYDGTAYGSPVTDTEWVTLTSFSQQLLPGEKYRVDNHITYGSTCVALTGAEARVLVDGSPTGTTPSATGATGAISDPTAFATELLPQSDTTIEVQARFTSACPGGSWFYGAASAPEGVGDEGTVGLSSTGSDVIAEVTATAGTNPADSSHGRLLVSWTRGASTSEVTSFFAQYSYDGERWDNVYDGTCGEMPPTAHSCVLDGLQLGVPTQVRILAVNFDPGTDEWITSGRTSEPVTPLARPGRPTSLVAAPGNTQVALSWPTPTADGGSPITDYVVGYRVAGTGPWTTFADGTSDETTAIVTGLTNGVRYELRVAAVNALGTGAWRATLRPVEAGLAFVPADQPPTITAVTPESGTADGGTPVTLTGTGFQGYAEETPSVTIGGSSATDVTVWDGGTTITAVTAAGTPGEADVVVTTDLGDDTLEAAYTYIHHVALSNGNLRFGTGEENSVNTSGTLQQPWYHSTVDGEYYKLTYDSYPLDYAIGSGTDGTNWSGAEVMGNPALTDQTIDYSGFVGTADDTGFSGHGTIVSTGITVLNGHEVTVRNAYTLPEGAKYVRVITRITNTGDEAIDNINLWVGTRDDYVGNSDQPTKTKGNLVDGAFVETSDAATPASGLLITSGDEGVLFYTTTSGANTSIDRCCNFSRAYNVDPVDSPTQLQGDGSYAINLPAGDVAVGESTELTWFYGAGSLADLGDVAAQVAAAAAPVATPGNGRVVLNWTAPESDQPITNYLVRYSSDGGHTWTQLPVRTPSSATTETITGLTNGTHYLVQVAAVTGTAPNTTQGPWSASPPAVTPGVPNAPVLVSGAPGVAQAVVTFTPSTLTTPTAPVTNYEYQVDGGAWVAFSPAVTHGPVTITELENGSTYSIRLRAVNTFGPSAPSAPLSVELVDGTAPDAPTDVAATAGDTHAVVTWTAPEDDGGSPVTDYVVEYSSDAGATWHSFAHTASAATTRDVTGLVNGTPYTFRITAVNAFGSSDPSDASEAITPAGPVGTLTYPTRVRLTVGTPYSLTPARTGTLSVARFRVTSGSLPIGLVLNSRTGVVTGTPMAQGGAQQVTITALGSSGQVVATNRIAFSAHGGFVVWFGPGSRTLTPIDRSALRATARAAIACPACRIEVRGYAAYVRGNPSAARQVAQLRADSVVRFLRHIGVHAQITKVIAVGYARDRTQDVAAQRKAKVTLLR